MSKNILVTIIGAGGAIQTNYAIMESDKLCEQEMNNIKSEGYRIVGKIVNKKYPFLATEELLTDTSFDRIYMIGTKDSSWQLLCNNIAEEKKMEPIELNQSDKKYQIIEEVLGNWLAKPVKIIEIEAGRTTREVDCNIKKMITSFSELFSEKEDNKELPEEVNITLDVSNGLRSIPMYVQAIMDYFSVLECSRYQCNIKIFYGMYDVQVKFSDEIYQMGAKHPSASLKNQEPRVAPILEMGVLTDLTKWSSAAREFYANGSVIQLLSLLDSFRKESFCKTGGSFSKWTEEYHSILSSFSFAMNSNNLNLFRSTIRRMSDLLKQESISQEDDAVPVYAKEILRSIFKNLTERFYKENKDETFSSDMFAIAEWYFEQKRFGDTAIALQEGILTYVMEKYPDRCNRLLDKKIRGWDVSKAFEKRLFDGRIRSKIRKTVFEENNEEAEEDPVKKKWLHQWRKWRKEYDYICNHIRNAAMLSVYHDNDKNNEEASIEEAEQKIRLLMDKMKDECHVKSMEQAMLAKRLDYLLDQTEYDVFISYRRSYRHKNEYDGLLLAIAIRDYLKKKGMKVFLDVEGLEGKSGKFTQHLHMELLNSKCCLVVLGKNAYKRPYSNKDEYYKEIVTAVKHRKKIFVVCMKGFSTKRRNVGRGVLEQRELKEIANKYQRIGGKNTDVWKPQQIMALRSELYKEINKFFMENNKLGV